MTKRSLALIVASFSLLTAVTTREARASQCGDSPEIAAQNVKLTPSPVDGCIKPSVSGSNRPGCVLLQLDLQNDCTDEVSVVLVEGATCPAADPNDDTCVTIAPGQSGEVRILNETVGPMSQQFTILHGGQTTTLYLTADSRRHLRRLGRVQRRARRRAGHVDGNGRRRPFTLRPAAPPPEVTSRAVAFAARGSIRRAPRGP
ncbi:MAG: hypothetical protein QM820_31780 [Minicystis sp.]